MCKNQVSNQINNYNEELRDTLMETSINKFE